MPGNGPHHQHLSTKTTKTMAVLRHGDTEGEEYPKLESITLHLDSDPIEIVSSFEYFGSNMSDDCSLTAKVEACISKDSGAFSSLNRALWYQRKIKQQTKIHLFNSVIIPVLGMCHTHCTTDKPDAELCDEVSQDHF